MDKISTLYIPPISIELKSFSCCSNQLTGKIPSFDSITQEGIERMKKIRSAERKKKIKCILGN